MGETGKKTLQPLRPKTHVHETLPVRRDAEQLK